MPVLYQQTLPRKLPALKEWAANLTQELKQKLTILLPLKENERAFIETLRFAGNINPELITNDIDLSKIIKMHPALLWASKKNQ